MRATTKAANVDRFMKNPRIKRQDSILPIVQTLWSLDLPLRIFQRCGAHITLSGVLWIGIA
jgi:hypothetical protein